MKDETVFEALQVLRKSNNQKQDDPFDIFGKHIANEIRSLDNINAQRWVKFKIQESIFQAQFNTHVPTQITKSNVSSFTAPQRAPQNVRYPVFPHSAQPFENNTSQRETQMLESPQPQYSLLGSPTAFNLP